MSGSSIFGSPPLSMGRISRLQNLVLLLVVLSGYASSQSSTKDYTNYTVYRVGLKTQEQLQAFLSYANQHALDIWRDPSVLPGSTERDADIMLPPAKRIDFVNRMKAIGATVGTFIPDVQRKINESASAQFISRRSGLESLTDQKYFTFEEIETLLEDLRLAYPDVVQLIPIGQTYEGRQMKVVYLSTDHQRSKPAIWLDAGIHAREWIAPAVALQAIHRLATDPNAADLLRSLDWYILPVFNPDGYEYSHTTDRMWRKTRSKRPTSKCFGVDANRNFEFYWKENGASSNPCSDTYAGPTSFSEPETVHVRDFLLQNKNNIKAYLTYHSYGKYLLYPWGYTYDLPENSDELDKLARDVNKAMVRAGSQPYKIGSSTNVLYPAAGGSDDWAKGVANISLAYTIELPGYGFGFQLPPQYITDVSNHVFVGLREFAKHVIHSGRSGNATDPVQPPPAVVGPVYRPKPVSTQTQNRPAGTANRPTSQKPFFMQVNPSRPRPPSRPQNPRPQGTPANTFYVPQQYPNNYPYPYPYPSDVYNSYNPQDPYYAGYYQPHPSVKTQPNPSNEPSGSSQQSGSSSPSVNPSVQSSGTAGMVQAANMPESPSDDPPNTGGFRNFRKPQPSNPAGSNQAAPQPSTGYNQPQSSRPAQSQTDYGMADPSTGSNQQDSRPASNPPYGMPEQSVGSSQQQNSRPAQNQYGMSEQSGGSNQQQNSRPAQNNNGMGDSSAGPSQSHTRDVPDHPVKFDTSEQTAVNNGAQNIPVHMPPHGSNLNINPTFGALFESNVPTSSEPYYQRPSGDFSFPSSGGVYQSESTSVNTGVSFPNSPDDQRPAVYAASVIRQPTDLVSALDSAPLWE